MERVDSGGFLKVRKTHPGRYNPQVNSEDIVFKTMTAGWVSQLPNATSAEVAPHSLTKGPVRRIEIIPLELTCPKTPPWLVTLVATTSRRIWLRSGSESLRGFDCAVVIFVPLFLFSICMIFFSRHVCTTTSSS